MFINEKIKIKIKEQKLIEESDNKLTESLFSTNPHTIDKSSSINVVKIGKNKFVSVIEKKDIQVKTIPVKQIINDNKHYDLNDYDYDFEDKY
jgi:hypothetical protein